VTTNRPQPWPAGEASPVRVPSRAVASPELIDKVTAAYELDWTGESTDLGGETNLNLALSGIDGPAYVIRVYTPWVSAKGVQFIQAVRSYPRDGGLPFAETLVTKHGQGVVEVDGRVAEIERYVAGKSMDERRQLGPVLAMLGRSMPRWGGRPAWATSTRTDTKIMWKPNRRSAGPGGPRQSSGAGRTQDQRS
jgi:Ser/Thr protein kinase RdoA (MazF antagonist)